MCEVAVLRIRARGTKALGLVLLICTLLGILFSDNRRCSHKPDEIGTCSRSLAALRITECYAYYIIGNYPAIDLCDISGDI